MKKLYYQNIAVVSAALIATVAIIDSQTEWLNPDYHNIPRERCYGIVKAGKNDCANAKHSCATQSTDSGDSTEWLMLPKGLCKKIVGGKT
jgi:uncharacterized membrane protein